MAPLSLALLGRPVITLTGEPIPALGPKALALLAFLAVEAAQPHRREELTGLLWPEQPEETARDNLRVALYRLRQALRPAEAATEAGPSPLEASREAIQFNTLSDHWLDLVAFNALLAECRTHAHVRMEACDECGLRLTQAVGLYRGDFLLGVSVADSAAFEEWLLTQREALRRQVLSALETLSAYHEGRGDYEALCREARRQLELEPWHEPAHRQLMRGLALSGDRNAALAQYETCRRVLAQELGIEPEMETRALAERLRAGELSPAVLAARPPAHNLPAHLTPFVGRERELAEVAARLAEPETRLLTLVGAGGMGKTRLATEAARARLDDFPDGVFFVSLAPLASASAIAPAIANAIGLELHGDPKQELLQCLRPKRLLLILDNFEHLLDGVSLAVEILQAAPQVRLIATSREQLGVRGEHPCAVEGMDYALDATLSQAAASSAVRLFVQSARRVRPSFKLSQANLSGVLRISQLVSGMPLGLELAAAWTETLPLEAIVAEIERNADFLATEWRDAPERQRSLWAVFDWSWNLLNDAERQVFRQLSVFRGGFTREAAQAVVGASLRVLTRLVHKSLLRWGEARGAASRYELHELLRQFAAEQLDASPDERTAVEARHSEFYLNFVAERERRLARNEPREAAAEIRGEIDNVRQAWDWAAAQARADDLERSLYGLWQFYWLTCLSLEGEERFGMAVEHIRQARGLDGTKRCGLLSKLLAVQALFMNRQCTYDRAIQAAQQAIREGQAGGNAIGEAMGYACWGQALYRQGLMRDARPHIARALDLSRDAQRSGLDLELLCEVELEALQWLGMLDKDAGDYQASRAHLTAALKMCDRLDKRGEECRYLVDLGEIAMILGDYAAATASSEAALGIARAHGARLAQGTAQLVLGLVALAEGHIMPAQDSLMGALDILHEVGDRNYEAYTLAYLGRLADSLGDAPRAQDLLERALRLSEDVGSWESRFEAHIGLSLLLQHSGDFAGARSAAQQSQKIAAKAGDRARQADTWLAVGRAQEGLQRLTDAATAYQHSLALNTELGRAHMIPEPRAGLARIALARGDLTLALAQVEAILKYLESHPLAGPDEPFRVYLTCYRVLEANGDPRAARVLQTAHHLLQEWAGHIADEALRSSFLENVPAHRELMRAFADATLAEPTIA